MFVSIFLQGLDFAEVLEFLHLRDKLFLSQKVVLCILKDAFLSVMGGVVRIENSGCVCLGTNFNANKNFSIFCNKSISFGNDVLIGWNVSVRDNDGHNIYRGLVPKCNIKEVLINNHVWIAAEVHILKGAVICDGSVVGYRATVFDQFSESNVLIGGYPAKVIQRNIKWEQ